MKCSIGCSEKSSPAVGMANLRGKPGQSCEGTSGQYALCKHHYTEIVEERWGNVILEGWEQFPEEPAMITRGV